MNNQKVIWTLMYKPPGTFITPEMLKEDGNILADECHSTTDGAFSYTYLHLKKRCRRCAMNRFLKKAKDKHGIALEELFGHDHGSMSVKHNAIFQILRTHSKEKNPAFVACTNNEPVLTKGLLFEAKPKTRPEKKAELNRRIAELEQQVEEIKTGNDLLMAENAELKARLHM